MRSGIHQVVFPSTRRNIRADLRPSQSQVTKSAHARNRNSYYYPNEIFLHLRSLPRFRLPLQHAAIPLQADNQVSAVSYAHLGLFADWDSSVSDGSLNCIEIGR